MPPHMIQDLTRSTFSNIEVQGTEFVQHCLLPHLRRWEAAISRDLIADDERFFAEHNVNGLLRGDSAAQSAFVTAMLDRGVYDIDEARAYLGMTPLPADAGKLRLVPLNMQTVESANAGPPEQPPMPEPAVSPVAEVESSPADDTEDQGETESRSLTISIDFDRTFAADPKLWGAFAKNAADNGNQVVMISRRPESDRQEVVETLGDYAAAFSQVLLVGPERLKEQAAEEAGVKVDVWVDDSPQFIKGA